MYKSGNIGIVIWFDTKLSNLRQFRNDRTCSMRTQKETTVAKKQPKWNSTAHSKALAR